jgi:hypothetical protein
MKSKNMEIFTVLVLGEVSKYDLLTADLSNNLTVSCTNKRSLEKITDISYDRLMYVFTRLQKSVLLEKGNLIIRSTQLYKGEQLGRKEGNKLIGYNR